MRGPRPPSRTAAGAERGMLLYAMIFVIAILGLLSLSLFAETQIERSELRRHENDLRAAEIAEVGLQRAEIEIRTSTDPGGDGLGVVSGSYFGGTYRTEAVLVDPARRIWRVVCAAEHGHSRRRLEVGLKVLSARLFEHALFSREHLEFKMNSWTDSYDSRLGTWASQATNVHPLYGPYADAGGHIGSNESIEVKDASIIRGDAIPGPGGSTSVAATSAVWGDTTPADEVRELEEPSLSEFQGAYASHDNASILRIGSVSYDPVTLELALGNNAEAVLTGGTYFFTRVLCAPHSRIRVTGPSVIYITDAIEMRPPSSLENTTGTPANCLIVAHPHPLPPGYTPTRKTIELAGAEITAAVYAPVMSVEFKSATSFWGSIAGDRIEVKSGSSYHFDEALTEVTGLGGGGTERIHWLDLDPPR